MKKQEERERENLPGHCSQSSTSAIPLINNHRIGLVAQRIAKYGMAL